MIRARRREQGALTGGMTNRATLASDARSAVATLPVAVRSSRRRSGGSSWLRAWGKFAVGAVCSAAAIWPAGAAAQSSGPEVQGEFIATLALSSVSQYPYCLGGGNIYGPTPGWPDPDSDGSYSTCWNEDNPNLPDKYGFD